MSLQVNIKTTPSESSSKKKHYILCLIISYIQGPDKISISIRLFDFILDIMNLLVMSKNSGYVIINNVLMNTQI